MCCHGHREATCVRLDVQGKKIWSQGISSLNSKAFLRLSSYYSCCILLTPIILNLQVSISPNDKIPCQALTTETFFQGGTPSVPQILNNIMVWMVFCTRLCCGTSGVKNIFKPFIHLSVGKAVTCEVLTYLDFLLA